MLEPDDLPPAPDAGMFGLDESAQPAVVFLPVPWEVTVSFREGTAQGPEAIRQASHQVDLFDLDGGDWSALGQASWTPPPKLLGAAERLRGYARDIIAGYRAGDSAEPAALAEVNRGCARMVQEVQEQTERIIDAGALPVVVGGDHSVAEGPLRAVLKRAEGPVGILHVDAHADLRVAYEGFLHSHASVFHNVLEADARVTLHQVGIRDVSEAEYARIIEDPRITTLFDRALQRAPTRREALSGLIAGLPQQVYLSLDVDGFAPDLCPNTGTPVPGGLGFADLVMLLELLSARECRIVGLDLCEVAPAADAVPGESWDATVGARVLYKSVGYALRSRGLQVLRPEGMV